MQKVHYYRFQNVAAAEQALFNCIAIYYNRQRKHSTNGYKSPAHFELEWWYNQNLKGTEIRSEEVPGRRLCAARLSRFIGQ